jgi:polyhydroxybutyrate depolymerase
VALVLALGAFLAASDRAAVADEASRRSRLPKVSSGVQLATELAKPAPPRYTLEQLKEHIKSNRGRPPKAFTLVLEHGGMTREALVHLPEKYSAKRRAPVVLNFHGLTSNARQQAAYTNMHQVAGKRGYISVHPQGSSFLGIRSWNGGRCCGMAVVRNVDDVGFVNKLLDQLEGTLAVNDRRVYSTGISNGGIFSYVLARRLPHRITAVAPVAGVDTLDTHKDARPSREVPVLHIHGDADLLVRYQGGSPGLGPAGLVERLAILTRMRGSWPRNPVDSVRGWADHNAALNQAQGSEPAQRQSGNRVDQIWKSPGGVETILRTIVGGHHAWLGDDGLIGSGTPEERAAGSREIIDFFEEYSFSRESPKARKDGKPGARRVVRRGQRAPTAPTAKRARSSGATKRTRSDRAAAKPRKAGGTESAKPRKAGGTESAKPRKAGATAKTRTGPATANPHGPQRGTKTGRPSWATAGARAGHPATAGGRAGRPATTRGWSSRGATARPSRATARAPRSGRAAR